MKKNILILQETWLYDFEDMVIALNFAILSHKSIKIKTNSTRILAIEIS